MADEKIYLTEEGYKEKEDRLNELRNVFRPAVVERIKFAKEQGDLSENAEYSAAREEQAKIEGEILELEEETLVCSPFLCKPYRFPNSYL